MVSRSCGIPSCRIPSPHPEALPQLLWGHRDKCLCHLWLSCCQSPSEEPWEAMAAASIWEPLIPAMNLHLACKMSFVKTTKIPQNWARMLLLFEMQCRICRRDGLLLGFKSNSHLQLTCCLIPQVFFSWNSCSDVPNDRWTKLYGVLHILLLWKMIHF